MPQVSGERTKQSDRQAEEASDEQLKTAQDAGRTALEGIDDTEIDDVLKDIDDVLEENAEEFVATFTQRGGQ